VAVFKAATATHAPAASRAPVFCGLFEPAYGELEAADDDGEQEQT
jgi:hypothetical protein